MNVLINGESGKIRAEVHVEVQEIQSLKKY